MSADPSPIFTELESARLLAEVAEQRRHDWWECGECTGTGWDLEGAVCARCEGSGECE